MQFDAPRCLGKGKVKRERALRCPLSDLLLRGELFSGVQHTEENDKYLIFLCHRALWEWTGQANWLKLLCCWDDVCELPEKFSCPFSPRRSGPPLTQGGQVSPTGREREGDREMLRAREEYCLGVLTCRMAARVSHSSLLVCYMSERAEDVFLVCGRSCLCSYNKRPMSRMQNFNI